MFVQHRPLTAISRHTTAPNKFFTTSQGGCPDVKMWHVLFSHLKNVSSRRRKCHVEWESELSLMIFEQRWELTVITNHNISFEVELTCQWRTWQVYRLEFSKCTYDMMTLLPCWRCNVCAISQRMFTASLHLKFNVECSPWWCRRLRCWVLSHFTKISETYETQ